MLYKGHRAEISFGFHLLQAAIVEPAPAHTNLGCLSPSAMIGMNHWGALVLATTLVVGEAESCDLAALTSLAATRVYSQCQLDADGFNFTEKATPDDATVSAICSSPACEQLAANLSSLDLNDCGIPVLSSYDNTCGSSHSGTNTGLIVGLVVGGIILLMMIIAGIVVRKKQLGPCKSTADQMELGIFDEIGDKGDGIQTSYRTLQELHSLQRDSATNIPAGQSSDYGIAPTGDTASTSIILQTLGSYGASTSSSSLTDLSDEIIVRARIDFDKIKLGKCIISGGFAQVYCARYDSQDVAVTMLLPAMRKNSSHLSSFLSEIKIAARVHHPNIVRFVGVAWQSISELYSVAEFVDGGNLRTMLSSQEYQSHSHPQGLSPMKLKIATQVVDALAHLHSLDPSVIHRGLKSRNILLTSSLDVKLTDFGASKSRFDHTTTTGLGTPLWMAPEVILGNKYDEMADIYSFGIVLFELDTHEVPYAKVQQQSGGLAISARAVLQLVTMKRHRLEFSSKLAPELRTLAERCLYDEPNQRPSAAELAQALRAANSLIYE